MIYACFLPLSFSLSSWDDQTSSLIPSLWIAVDNMAKSQLMHLGMRETLVFLWARNGLDSPRQGWVSSWLQLSYLKPPLAPHQLLIGVGMCSPLFHLCSTLQPIQREEGCVKVSCGKVSPHSVRSNWKSILKWSPYVIPMVFNYSVNICEHEQLSQNTKTRETRVPFCDIIKREDREMLYCRCFVDSECLFKQVFLCVCQMSFMSL